MSVARTNVVRMSTKSCVQTIIEMITTATPAGAMTKLSAIGTITPAPRRAATTAFSQLRRIEATPAPSMAASMFGFRYKLIY
jgi:hypothetical protein